MRSGDSHLDFDMDLADQNSMKTQYTMHNMLMLAYAVSFVKVKRISYRRRCELQACYLEKEVELLKNLVNSQLKLRDAAQNVPHRITNCIWN